MEKVSGSIFMDLYNNTTEMIAKFKELISAAGAVDETYYPDIMLDVLNAHEKEIEKIYEASEQEAAESAEEEKE